MAVTIKDVAKMAGVSISTVSRVINDSKPVSPESRRKVLHAIETLGYEPNEIARSLVTKRSNLIGVIVDDIGNYYISQIVRGIEEIGRMYNYDIVLCSSYGDAETELKFLQLLRSKQVEGVIIASEIINKELIDLVDKLRIEIMYLNRYYSIPELPTITIDTEKAINLMMDHLKDLGHRKIVYLTQENDIDLRIENTKIKTYKEAMKNMGGQPLVHRVDSHRIDGGYKAGPKLVEILQKHDATAVFCCQDELAIGLMNYMYDNNIKVPEDVSVVGYGDISVAGIYRPALTTIREPYYDIGAVAIRKILKELIGESIDDRNIELPVRLIKRKSSQRI